jgi:hypothetical protein
MHLHAHMCALTHTYTLVINVILIFNGIEVLKSFLTKEND